MFYDLASRKVVRTFVSTQTRAATYSLAYSLDGTKLFAAGKGGAVVAWDPNTGLEIERREGHTGDIFKIAISPVTGQLASAGTDHNVLIWPADPGSPPMKLEGHSDIAACLAWLADASHIASGSFDGTVRIWNTSSGMCEQTLKMGEGRDAQVHSIALADSGRVLVCGTAGGRAEVFETAHWTHVGTLNGHKGVVHCIESSPDGTRVATGSFDTTVRVWDIHTYSELILLPAHLYQVLVARFSADGSQLVTSGGGKVKFWVAGSQK
jgi:WD40 repeat protein